MNIKILQILIFFYIITFSISQTETINLKDIDDSIQCYHLEKMTFGESEEITYELINNKLDKILFIQFRSITSILIYKTNTDNSNIIFSKTKEELKYTNFENYYFNVEKDVDKYIIKVEFLHDDISEYKMCFNLFEQKGNSFKTISGKTQKIATYEIINSGKFPLFINNNLKTFTSLRINKKFEKYFTVSGFHIKAKLFDSEEDIDLEIHEYFNGIEYVYIFWNLNLNKGKKIKEIFIEMSVNINKFEEENNKLEIEMINNQEIHYECSIKSKKCEDCPKIFYIDLKKYIFEQDMDILCFSSISNDIAYISDSYNINKENSFNLEKNFYVFNKNYFKKEKYKNLNPNLLFFIIDEKSVYTSLDLIYSFVFAGSSHQKYIFNEDTKKSEIFKNNKMIINSKTSLNFYLINYFSDFFEEYIMELESIIGKTDIYYTNTLSLSRIIPDYLDRVDKHPINILENSLIQGDYGLFRISCEPSSQRRVLSYLNIFKKNEINDVIYFSNQKALLYIEQEKQHSFTFDSNLLQEKFKIRIRVSKKDEGNFNIDINYNNFSYKTLNEDNFLELKHEKGENPILYITIQEITDRRNKLGKRMLFEIIKDLNIDNNLIEIKKNNVYNSTLIANKFLFIEYYKKSSTKIKLYLYNEQNEEVNICIHKGYGIYPYLIKPECSKGQLINLKKSESVILEYENPFFNNNNLIKNINSDNHLYISLFSSKDIKYDYIYEKYSNFNLSDDYKDLDFNGKEIIQLDNNKGYPYIYYQINICQDFNNILQFDSYKPILFNYYFDEKQSEIKPNNIKTDIYKSYKINTDSKKPFIIFTKDETIKGKFKYTFSPLIADINFDKKFSKEIKVEQINNKITVNLETPFHGDLILYFLFISSDLEKYNGVCRIIDFLDSLKKNIENQKFYGNKLIKKEITVNESDNILNIDIDTKEIVGINRKDVKLYVINKIKIINIDLFYHPYNLHININDHFTTIEDEQNIIKKIVIFLSCLIFIFIIFIFYRSHRRKKRLNEIEYDKKNLTDDVNETNKLF